jgi:hypothetical protein
MSHQATAPALTGLKQTEPSLAGQERESGSTRTALKEWAVACEALGRGQQILLLRKGGISEEHREFRLQHSEFLLFPSYEHQRPDLLKPFARDDLAAVLARRGPADRLELRYWARVAKIFDLTEGEQLAAISPLHLWSDDYALERLRWRPRKPLQLMALRVHRLAEPATLPVLAGYGGCKSWLTLAEPVLVEGARPVLDDTSFNQQLERLRRALGNLTADEHSL